MTTLPNLLIVDDKKLNLDLLQSFVKEININLIRAQSGASALEKVRGVELALAIIDVQMPEMNGYEFAKKLNEERTGGKVPVIFVTAGDFDEVEAFRGYDCGAVDYIFKPVKKHVLLCKINVFLDLFAQKQKISRNLALLKESAEELTRVNDTIRKSEANVHRIFNQSPVGSVIVGLDKYFIRCNAAFCNFIGYTEDELIGKTFSEVTHPEDIELGLREMRLILDGETESCSFEKRYIRKDGKTVWGEISIGLVRDTNNVPLYFLPVIQDITLRKEAEEQLRESKGLFELIYKLTPGAAQITRLDEGCVISVNDGFTELSGFTREDILGKSTLDIDLWEHPEDRQNIIDDLTQKGYSDNYEATFKRKDGSLFIGLLAARVFSYKDKPHVITVTRDITTIKEAQKALQESEEKFKILSDLAPAGIYMTDKEGNCLYTNPKWNEMAGMSTQESLGKGWIRGLHPDDRELVISNWQKMVESGGHWGMEYRFQTPEGKVTWIFGLANPQLDSSGKVIGYIGMNMDITERKLALDELLRKDILLNITGQTAKVGGWELDVESSGQIWTDEVYRIHEVDFTFKPNLIKGINFFAPNSRPVIEKAVQRAVESGEPFDLELEFITNKGNLRWVRSIGKAAQTNGKTIKVYGSIQDITESKKIGEEIKLKNEELFRVNAEKDKFFSIIAHDLRGPFNVLVGLSRLMVEELPNLTLDQIQKFALNMKNAAGKLLSLLENLLEWSQMQHGLRSFTPKSFLLVNGIAPIIELVRDSADKKMIHISYDVPEDLRLMADLQMFESIMRNLIFNAVKFTPKNGRITIEAMPISGTFVRISIKDTGIGMNKDMIDNLFRIDVNTNRAGTEGEPCTGLGLIICRDFIEKHGGKLWVESEEGSGSTFYFSLPLDPVTEDKTIVKNVVSEVKVADQISPDGPGLKILIAEDDEISEMLVKMALTASDKEILTVKTGIDAVEICRNHPDIDMVLMDIRMPGIDGYEATRQIRLFNKNVVIIAQTAYGLSGEYDKAIEAGCNDYITKPLNISLLKEMIMRNIKK